MGMMQATVGHTIVENLNGHREIMKIWHGHY